MGPPLHGAYDRTGRLKLRLLIADRKKGAIMGFYSSHIDIVRPNVMMSHYGYITRKGKYANLDVFVFS